MRQRVIFIITIIICVLAILFFVRFFVGGDEDSWIKDSRGVWIKHGAPAETPAYVLEQQQAVDCAVEKFSSFTGLLNSQCLGTCGNYAVDIVHVPRTSEDNLVENQCSDYREGKVSQFIELDKYGGCCKNCLV
ncbi:MAG: hypothetical protein NTW17_01195 [Candidatus Pacearchaeota archaeon]|nr:hypothetical protein [Candidatus Pacearchaeota archaeon]